MQYTSNKLNWKEPMLVLIFNNYFMKQVIIILSLICLLPIFNACRQKKEKDTVNNHDIQVTLTNVKEIAVNRHIQIHGVVSSEEITHLSFKLPGIIRSLQIKEGDIIRKGAPLAELDLTEIEAQYTQAQESFEKQLRDHKRVETLYRDSVVTQEQWQNSLTALTLAEQSLKVAHYNRQHTTIYAPSDGVVLSKHAKKGEYVNPGQPVMQLSLYSDKELVLRAGVSVSDWLNLSIGDTAEWEAEAFPKQLFSGKVKHIAQTADPQSGLYQVEIGLTPGKQKIVVGMFAKATIQTQKRTIYKCIPCTCLHDGQGQEAHIYIPDGKHVKKVPVTVVFIQEGQAYISAGLDSISQVIDEGSAFLSPYSTISIQ